jgi:hypothetical protein
MRRRTLLVALVALAVVVAVGVVALWPRPRPQPSSRITRENFDRIKVGMTRAEVEAILGPEGDHRTRHGETEMLDGSWNPDWTHDGPLMATWRDPAGGPSVGVWISDSVFILIYFDDDSVTGTEAQARRSAGSPLKNIRYDDSGRVYYAEENLLWRIKRLWRRWFPE